MIDGLWVHFWVRFRKIASLDDAISFLFNAYSVSPKKVYAIRAPDHPPKETATRCNDKGCGFLISQNNKKASSFSHSDFYALFHESGGLKIMAKVNLNSPLTMEEAFESFLFSKSAQGLTDKTLKSYKSHFKCISKYLDTTIKLNSLKKETIYKMIAEMRQTDLSPNTIASYPLYNLFRFPRALQSVSRSHK